MAELVVALDMPKTSEALAMAERLRGAVPWVKIGLELFTLGGPQCVEALKKMDFRIFLDLKMYDIPNTVASAVKAAALMGVDMLTLHTQGGADMCRAAREALGGADRPLLFGVTVLTSMGPGDLPAYSGSDIAALAKNLAVSAYDWGLDGVVSSGHEVKAIKAACPKLLCLTPGIRPAGSAVGDQKRVMTPALAVREGSDFLVVGRPITRAEDPAAAARDISRDMRSN